jgi:hypothetical protein
MKISMKKKGGGTNLEKKDEDRKTTGTSGFTGASGGFTGLATNYHRPCSPD